MLPVDPTAVQPTYALPDGAIFPDSAPRYPNIWLLVHESLASSYRAAVTLAMQLFEDCTDMYNDFGYAHTAEGCDAFTRRRGLQPVKLGPDGSRSHDHCIHFRFYYAPLREINPVVTEQGRYYQIAASVHYEVDRPKHLHPYVDECPYCGCTGEYERLMDAGMKEKNEELHDPLGVELLLYGTIRGEEIVAFNGLQSLKDRYDVQIREVTPDTERSDITTAKVGVVFLGAKEAVCGTQD